jgi:hypothetical protein
LCFGAVDFLNDLSVVRFLQVVILVGIFFGVEVEFGAVPVVVGEFDHQHSFRFGVEAVVGS